MHFWLATRLAFGNSYNYRPKGWKAKTKITKGISIYLLSHCGGACRAGDQQHRNCNNKLRAQTHTDEACQYLGGTRPSQKGTWAQSNQCTTIGDSPMPQKIIAVQESAAGSRMKAPPAQAPSMLLWDHAPAAAA